MIKTIVAVGLGVLMCMSALPASADAPLPPELEVVIESFYAAIESGDAEARIELLADDIVMMPNHWTMIRARVRLRMLHAVAGEPCFGFVTAN